ncbi:uncharacterized protein (DUF305 family) [Agromyces hippuratus]|uniref:Uncharacterized protein (DUF305 family) n=1 Tax=Agromyces hippuratus TaxID=286438 RepID=A0A852WVK1_9MICO|nr:DUF305 domain-containing protein [Agromyces hippuratus]NYG19993.1 uncharacterized protein (DUF305 family) [Agromyces hippuratus]
MFARRYRGAGIAALVIATGAALAACTINIGSPDTDRDRRSGMMSDTDSAAYDPADLMFAQMMIPHHQQAVDMSELAIEKSTDPEVLALAEQIRDAQTVEIALMEGWLEDAGVRMPMGDRMPMGGMLSDDEMTALEDATAAEFDRLYLEGMIDHHEGAILMARMILDSDNPEVRALGEAIVESQTAEIELMTQMLGE